MDNIQFERNVECVQTQITGSEGKFCEENRTMRNKTLKPRLRLGACNFHLLNVGEPLA